MGTAVLQVPGSKVGSLDRDGSGGQGGELASPASQTSSTAATRSGTPYLTKSVEICCARLFDTLGTRNPGILLAEGQPLRQLGLSYGVNSISLGYTATSPAAVSAKLTGSGFEVVVPGGVELDHQVGSSAGSGSINWWRTRRR